MKQRHLLSLTLLSFLILAPTAIFACQKKDGVADFNCDGKVKITVLGDSLVFGTGDSSKGGYVTRTSTKFPEVEFINLGEAGLRAGTLLMRLSKQLKSTKDNKYTRAIFDSDIVVLDLGRNDRWLFGEPAATARDLAKTVDLIRTRSEQKEVVSPMVVTAVLMLPNRGSQGPWVAELNKVIFSNSSDREPADLRFDKVSKRLLSSDNIHPTPKGYSEITKVFVSYLKNTIGKHIRPYRSDDDNDGIYDMFENEKFGTDPLLNDTDGDGKSDGQEVYETLTNPLVVD